MKIRRQPRVLYLSFYFPPSRASGVYRGRATANYLADRGWKVTVLASPLRFLYEIIGSVDEGLAATVHPAIRVERPSMNYFIWEQDLRRFGRVRATMPTLARKVHDLAQLHLFPEPYAAWGVSAVARALRLHSRRRFDVVLATGNPFASFAAAWLFHRLTGVPYVIDYRDSWTLNLFTDSPAYPDAHIAWKWERRVMTEASAIVFVNDALRGWHARRYPNCADRMMVVPNGWDRDLMPTSGAVHVSEYDGEARPLNFGYLGTVTNSQPVEQMAAAFERARSHPLLADAQLNIYGHLGFFKGHTMTLAERLGLPPEVEAGETNSAASGIRYRGPVSKTDVATVYQDSDVLVFLAGGGRYVTSGKIFEYMASGRPIVSVHAPGIAAAEVLDGYPLWFNANSLDVDEIAQSMIAAAKAARDLSPQLRAAALRHADAYARENLVGQLENRLRSLVRRRVRARTNANPQPLPPLPMAKVTIEKPVGERGMGRHAAPSRAVILSFASRPAPRVTAYVRSLVAAKVQVELFVAEEGPWREFRDDPLVRLHVPGTHEDRRPLLRVERFLVHLVPGRSLSGMRRLVLKARLGWALGRPLTALMSYHVRIADVWHKRFFMRAYRVVRPRLLARDFRRELRGLDLVRVDRIVATDVLAVTLGRALAKRCPRALATTSLDF